ncbi:MAG: hypothetical protein IKS41_04600 [Alphaproteobacteria bacterium]|nr:hypothetical protein [Alphaproteobacteria bacterium]
MKKLILLILLLAVVPVCVQADERTTEGMTEAEQLGVTAGLALACNAGGKLDDFELIASRLIANKALTAEAEQKGYREFAEAKFRAYNEQKNDPQESCGAILDSFNRLPLFRSVVFADGGLKMYDGTYLKPKRPVKFTEQKVQVKKKK